jgi:hypothetical protein
MPQGERMTATMVDYTVVPNNDLNKPCRYKRRASHCVRANTTNLGGGKVFQEERRVT